MAVPPHVAAAIIEHKLKLPSRQMAFAIDKECAGAKFHSPKPHVLVRVPLTKSESVWLCPTCAHNFDILQRLLKVDSRLSWVVRREFGNRLRALVARSMVIRRG